MLVRRAAALLLLFFCALMLNITLPYLLPPFPTHIDFLSTKQNVLPLAHWRWAFYVHISSSFFVLLFGGAQFSRGLLRAVPRLHRLLGKVYVALICLVSAPSGLVMAVYANGGVVAKAAFVMQAVLWWGFTYMAFRQIRKGRLREHGVWMFRSYAMTLSAVSLRLFSYLLAYNGIMMEAVVSYTLLAWTSWTFNLLVAQLLIHWGIVDYYFKRR